LQSTTRRSPPNHLIIAADGHQFWFRTLDSDLRIHTDDEPLSEGWLRGGEELLLGNSALYFFAPQLTIFPEFDDFEYKDDEIIGDIPDFNMENYEDEAKPKKKASPPLWMLLIFGLYIAGGVVLWSGYSIFASNYITSATQQEKREYVATKLFPDIVKVNQMIEQNQWREAEPVLKQAQTIAPVDSPFQEIVQKRLTQVNGELKHLYTYDKALKLYQNNEWPDALGLIAQLPKKRYAYRHGQALRQKIFEKEVKPLFRTIGLMIDTGKFKDARQNLEKVFAYDPDLTAAVDLQQRLEKRDPEGSRAANREAAMRLEQGLKLFKQGQHAKAMAYFQSLENKERGLVKRKAGTYQQRIRTFVDVLSRGIKAANDNNHGRAVALLLQAHNLNQPLGGSSGSYSRRLANSLYQQGKSAEAQKRYGQAMNYYKRALQFVSGYGPSRQAIQSLHSKANNLYAQAVILVGVDDKEARNLLKQILQMLPPSDRLYKKAQAKLRSF
jgi:hypothetical protein